MPKIGTVVVLTARSTSDRLRNKTMLQVVGKPLIYWVAKRLLEVGHLVLAVPKGDPLKDWGNAEGFNVFEGSEDDVTGRIMGAVEDFYPSASYIMRGLGDCPFVVPEFAKRAVAVMKEHQADAFQWVLAPFTYTVYGATEFPRARRVWDTINKFGVRDEREHPDLYFHRHRSEFNLVYHEPPPSKFFRPYRLEVDWKEDAELMKRLGAAFGRLPTAEEAIDYLDRCDDWKINWNRIERTGITVSYTQVQRAMWWRDMKGKPIVRWNDSVLRIPSNGEPTFCNAKRCLLGHTDGKNLYTLSGEVIGEGHLNCQCGAGRGWSAKR